jgi:transcription antitermination factor NusG
MSACIENIQVDSGSSTDAEREVHSLTGAEFKWFALGVTSRHEKIASQVLRSKGYHTFLPSYVRRHQYGHRTREFDLPLFPGYLFCRLDPLVRLPVLTTPGVLRLIGAGRSPIPVEDEEITSLQRASEAGVSMTPYPYWQTGQKGRITGGPLAGVEGIVLSARHPVRLVLSVRLLQRSVLLEIDYDCVVLA